MSAPEKEALTCGDIPGAVSQEITIDDMNWVEGSSSARRAAPAAAPMHKAAPPAGGPRRGRPLRTGAVQDDETRDPCSTDANSSVQVQDVDSTQPSTQLTVSTSTSQGAPDVTAVLKVYPFMFEEEIHSLFRLFTEWDSDHDGEITIDDMKRMMKALREAQIQELFGKIDMDNSGLLDKREVFQLINLLSADELTQSELEEAMNEMDGDASGKVEPGEFSSWWRHKETQGEDQAAMEQELKDLFSEVDDDQSGMVDWNEFVHMICRKMEIEGREDVGPVGGSKNPKLPEPKPEARTGEKMARLAIESVRQDARAIYGSSKIPKGMLERARELEDETQTRICFYNTDGKRLRDLFRKAWDIMQVVLLAYVAMAVPYRVGFLIDVPFGHAWWWFEVLVDVYFALDIIMNFRTSYRNQDGELVTDLKLISSNYIRSWFFIDLAACLPITYIGILLNGIGSDQSTGQSLKVLKILRLLRLAKMLRLARVKRVLKRMDEDFPGIWPTSKLCSLIMIILYMGHIFACGWFMAGSTDQIADNGLKIQGWVVSFIEDRQLTPDHVCVADTSRQICDAGVKYLDAVYYAVTTLTTVGYGDRTPKTDVEKVFSILTELAGGILFGILAGTLSTMVMATNVAEKRKEDMMLELREFLASKRIKKSVRRHVMTQMENFYKKKSPFDEKVVLSRLAPKFRKLLLLTMYKPLLIACPLFMGLDDAIITRLCVILHPYLAAKQDDVVTEGEIGDEMYMVTRGEITLYSETLPKLNGKTWVDGAFFGEIPVLRLGTGDKHNRHVYTARALEESDLTFITSKDIDEVGVDFPHFKKQIVQLASKRAQRFGLVVGKGQKRRPDPIVNAVVERLDKLEDDQNKRLGAIEDCLQTILSRTLP